METVNASKILHTARAAVTGVVFLLALAVSAGVSRAQFTGLYAFGDSLSDRGNTYNALGGKGADEAIYQLVGYTTAPDRYDDGRWSNGPVWVEHLGGMLGLPPLQRNNGMQPLLEGTNFAFGGATTGTGYTDGILANVQTQVGNYVSLAGGTASSTALYTVWAGGNDVIYYVTDGQPNTPSAIEQLASTMATNIGTAVTTLYDSGARHFLVPNLPPLGDKPDFVDTPKQAFANDIVTTYNPKLEQTLISLREQFPEVKLASWDVYSDFSAMLQDPMSYGFTNEKDAAFSSAGSYPGMVAANPNQHVFWDHTHPSAAGHALLGDYAYEALTVLLVPEPSTLALLCMSIGIVCAQRRVGNRMK